MPDAVVPWCLWNDDDKRSSHVLNHYIKRVGEVEADVMFIDTVGKYRSGAVISELTTGEWIVYLEAVYHSLS